MDFLNHQHIVQLRNQIMAYQYRERRSQELLDNMHDQEFKSHFRFTKDRVTELAEVLNDRLG